VTAPSINFPIGRSVSAEALAVDPYPIYARMQAAEPISWIPALNMYYAVKYEHVHAMLNEPARFAAGTEQSTLFDTFGSHMLTEDSSKHERQRKEFSSSFTSTAFRNALENVIVRHVDALIDGFEKHGQVDLRKALAARLPILTMLSLFGIPLEREGDVRHWYDSFEAALANFQWDNEVRHTARRNVDAFRDMIGASCDHYSRNPNPIALLSRLIHSASRLDQMELEQNSLIVFFGGISTVEALILNSVFALCTHPQALAALRANGTLMSAVLDETIRWSGPVQSATRHVVFDTSFAGVEFRQGDTVNCMIAAANRDPAKFANPQQFDIERAGLRHHLGFGAGLHHCLGSHLAKLETRIALDRLLLRLPDWRVDHSDGCAPYGSEFRKPPHLLLSWTRAVR
jgi:cytochrome P450